MSKIRFVQWWKCKSIVKFMIICLLSMLFSFLSIYFIPNIYCLIGVFLSCFIGGYFMRKLLPSILAYLVNYKLE